MTLTRSLAVLAKAFTAAVLLLLVQVAIGWAASCPQTTLVDLEDEVMCPVCGTLLGIATEAPQAKRERAFIRRQIAQCKSKSEVKQALVAEFGPEVLALPPKSGFNLSAWLVPAAALLVAACGILFALIRWRRQISLGIPEGTRPSSAQNATVEKELERLDP